MIIVIIIDKKYKSEWHCCEDAAAVFQTVSDKCIRDDNVKRVNSKKDTDINNAFLWRAYM